MRARGQTLALFALSLLLLVLMVMVSLSISTRIKERIELQSTADAAAYSEAVVRARAFNAVALMNRTQISHMVGLATVSSLVSWAGTYRAALKQAKSLVQSMKQGGCYDSSGACICAPALCQCQLSDGDLTCAENKIQDQLDAITRNWDIGGQYDIKAGTQQRRVNAIAASYYSTELDVFTWAQQQIEGGSGPTIAERIAANARNGSPWASQTRELFTRPLSGPGSVTYAELADAVDGDVRAPVETKWDHAVQIAMGTRGRQPNFVNGRAGGAAALEAGLEAVFGACGFSVAATDEGSGYFGSRPPTAADHGGFPNEGATFSWGCDHVTVTVTRTNPPNPSCRSSETGNAEGWVKATDDTDTSDQHIWNPGADDRAAHPANEVHDLIHCIDACPGIWPVFIDYKRDELAEPQNIWGQPKNMVVMMRDFSVRTPADPWSLAFDFHFSSSGSRLDLKKRTGPSVQTALATGLTYYHRGASGSWGTHWREQPNFFNPFWRATLVAPDVDEPYPARGDARGDSAKRTLVRWGAPAQATTALDALVSRGFRGLQ